MSAEAIDVIGRTGGFRLGSGVLNQTCLEKVDAMASPGKKYPTDMEMTPTWHGYAKLLENRVRGLRYWARLHFVRRISCRTVQSRPVPYRRIIDESLFTWPCRTVTLSVPARKASTRRSTFLRKVSGKAIARAHNTTSTYAAYPRE